MVTTEEITKNLFFTGVLFNYMRSKNKKIIFEYALYAKANEIPMTEICAQGLFMIERADEKRKPYLRQALIIVLKILDRDCEPLQIIAQPEVAKRKNEILEWIINS